MIGLEQVNDGIWKFRSATLCAGVSTNPTSESLALPPNVESVSYIHGRTFC
jgi:hypothetical protein